KRMDAQNSVRTAAAQLLGVIGLGIGAVFTARTFQLNRQGQITDRFSHAVDHIGSDQLDVRLGGIYALERIARDSKRDHAQIMEVLTAYLRHRSRERTESFSDYPDDLLENEMPRMPPDLQAALTVLARRNLEHERHHPIVLDLSAADLHYADFF